MKMEKEYVKLRGFLIFNRRQYLEQSRDSKKPEATKTEKEKKLQEVTRFEPSGLLCVEHSRRKSVCETPPECGILEASFEEDMERNHLGNFDQDGGQLSEATEGLHGCKRRTF